MHTENVFKGQDPRLEGNHRILVFSLLRKMLQDNIQVVCLQEFFKGILSSKQLMRELNTFLNSSGIYVMAPLKYRQSRPQDVQRCTHVVMLLKGSAVFYKLEGLFPLLENGMRNLPPIRKLPTAHEKILTSQTRDGYPLCRVTDKALPIPLPDGTHMIVHSVHDLGRDAYTGQHCVPDRWSRILRQLVKSLRE
jgi:hypothetical protein